MPPLPGPVGGAPSACKSVSRSGNCRLRDWQTQAHHEMVARIGTCASRNVVPHQVAEREKYSMWMWRVTRATWFTCVCSWLLLLAAALPKDVEAVESAKAAYGERGMVASVNPVATKAGVDALKSGGNAIDAAVAVALTLGVVDGNNSGIGGGCFMLIRRADGKVIAIDGREMAPAAATRDMFVRNGKGDTQLSQTGALASGVPGALAAYDYAVKNFGKKKLGDLILPAAQIADDGFRMDAHFAGRVRSGGNGSRPLRVEPGGVFQKRRGIVRRGRFVPAERFGGDISEHREGGSGLVLSRAVRQSG